MDLSAYLHFFAAIAWFATAMAAAALGSAGELRFARHTAWLMAFGVTLAATRAIGFFEPVRDPHPALEPSLLGALIATMLWWEFARRTWNDCGRRQVSAATHALVAEVILVLAAVTAAATDTPPTSFDILLGVAESLPLLLGVAGWLMLWHSLSSSAARGTAALGFAGAGAHGLMLLPEAWGAAGGVFAPFAAAAGLVALAYRMPDVRSRPALVFSGAFLLAGALGPFLSTAAMKRADADYRATLIAAAHTATQGMRGMAVSRLRNGTPEARDAAAHLLAEAAKLAANDASIRDAELWRLRDGRIETLGVDGTFSVARLSTIDERAGERIGLPFVVAPAEGSRAGTVKVHSPVRATRFESPAVWLAIEYPGAFRAQRLENARRVTGFGALLLAAFCVAGFTLAVRQTADNRQRALLDRTLSASRAKTEFLAFLSHELRTPLQTILGRAELIARDATSPAPAAAAIVRHADAIETQGQLLLRLVTDLLDLGTLEAGKFQLRPHPFSLRQALAAVEDTVRERAAAKQLALTIDIAADVPDSLLGDEARLRQIIGNLLGNAVKFTVQGSVRLDVTTTPHGIDGIATAVRFRVSDTGPGLPPDKLAQLFNLFVRLDSGESFRREGTGVGLALVRRLCESMGGSVAAANRPEGGAEFTVQLVFPHAPETPPIPAPRVTAARGFRVLVAEDNASARDYLVEALQALGHDPTAVNDGDTAFKAASSGRFDAVLLDINLPGRDGVSIARELATSLHRPRLIGCSAEAFAHTRDAALAAGMHAFLEKPVTLAALANALGEPRAHSPEANLFERLRAPQLVANARASLQQELPRAVAAMRAALARGDAAAVQRVAHALRSTALLANDREVAELCRQLETDAAAGGGENIAVMLGRLAESAAPA